MPLLWSVQWSADPTSYQVLGVNRCRIAGRFEAETLAEIRQQAVAKAVEIALERRVPLDCVFEARKRYRG